MYVNSYTHMPPVALLCLWYCIWYSVSVVEKDGRHTFHLAFRLFGCQMCVWYVSVYMSVSGVHVCKGKKKRKNREAFVPTGSSPRLPFTRLFKLQSKMGNMKLGPHSSFWLVPPPCDPGRDTGPITINTDFLGLTAKNRMFVVCCNWASLKC